ncbi:hypothetical protein [Virgibacillus sp. Bac332]|uniref:hypothetical protein n=1 Tax=Virgibacillus sp. Bac332 TaxID=2419842 RepID=UPI001F08AB63|nr:hypothetical protein [Virgibacillus sp. Bac332]
MKGRNARKVIPSTNGKLNIANANRASIPPIIQLGRPIRSISVPIDKFPITPPIPHAHKYGVTFGTLAVVLKKNNEAAWTISLNENFEVDSAASQSNVGNIRLYKATLEENQPITLHYKSSN